MRRRRVLRSALFICSRAPCPQAWVPSALSAPPPRDAREAASVPSALLRRHPLTSSPTAVSLPALARSFAAGPQMDRAEFLQVYEKLKAELLQDSPLFRFTPDSRDWVARSLDHNVPGGKLNRGLSVVDSAAALVAASTPGAVLSEEQKFQAAVLGWGIEWLQGYFLVMDDIMDKSVTRRGKPCWYRVPKVGMIAINDAILFNSHIFLMLQRHFKGHPKYLQLLELFNEVSYQTACGQMLDLITTPEGELDLNKYTMDTYLKIVQFKTAYYSFYLPVASAMLMVDQWDEKRDAQAKEALVEMGTYFQVQDDFLDCYGDPKVIGKIGTDIEDSKCSWLVVTALTRASPEQRTVLETHYGKSDPASVAAVKALYNELDIKGAYEQYEAKCYADLVAKFEQVDPSLKPVLTLFLKKIFKRTS